MFRSGAGDEACEVGTAVDLFESCSPHFHVHLTLKNNPATNLLFPLLPAKYTSNLLMSLYTSCFLLLLLSEPKKTSLNAHLYFFAPTKILVHHFFSFLHPTPPLLSASLTSTYSLQTCEFSPPNERIWLRKMNHRSKTSKLNTFTTHLPFTKKQAEWFTSRSMHPALFKFIFTQRQQKLTV